MKKLGSLHIKEEIVDINISPLIDMMFLLLIFFIVTASFVDEVGVEIQRPKASAVQTLDKKSIQIGITKSGKIIYGEEEVEINELRSMVTHMMRKELRPIVIIADSSSLSGLLIDVIDECKAGGAKEVAVATETE